MLRRSAIVLFAILVLALAQKPKTEPAKPAPDLPKPVKSPTAPSKSSAKPATRPSGARSLSALLSPRAPDVEALRKELQAACERWDGSVCHSTSGDRVPTAGSGSQAIVSFARRVKISDPERATVSWRPVESVQAAVRVTLSWRFEGRATTLRTATVYSEGRAQLQRPPAGAREIRLVVEIGPEATAPRLLLGADLDIPRASEQSQSIVLETADGITGVQFEAGAGAVAKRLSTGRFEIVLPQRVPYELSTKPPAGRQIFLVPGS